MIDDENRQAFETFAVAVGQQLDAFEVPPGVLRDELLQGGMASCMLGAVNELAFREHPPAIDTIRDLLELHAEWRDEIGVVQQPNDRIEQMLAAAKGEHERRVTVAKASQNIPGIEPPP